MRAGVINSCQCVYSTTDIASVNGTSPYRTRASTSNLRESPSLEEVSVPKLHSHGVIWGDNPVYLPIRFGADHRAALSLMRLEKRFPLHGKARARQPLFQMGAGKPFTFCYLFRVLDDLKDNFLPVYVNNKLFTYHSCRIYLATSLDSPEKIQAICRWQSARSLGIYNRMQPQQYVTLLDGANSAVITSYTTTNLQCIDSYEEVAGPHSPCSF